MNRFWNSKDFLSSITVFFVALPLCLGIALASKVPIASGLIAGILGGVVVGLISNSRVSVSGPAAGLVVLVLAAIQELGSFESLLVSILIAGIFQVILGALKFGRLADFIPSSVIKGMLASIGIVLILKQIPHAVGFDADYEGDENFWQLDGENTFTDLMKGMDYLTIGAVVIAIFATAVLLFFSSSSFKSTKWGKFIPATLLTVVLATVINHFLPSLSSSLLISPEHLVSVPKGQDVLKESFPNFSVIGNGLVWIWGLKIAMVASLESLLSIEASDKMDPHHSITNPNRELLAQGTANIFSGLLGGLPITAVIVRSSANVYAGATSKRSTIYHGLLLLFCLFAFHQFLNLIPLAVLAVILIQVGFKLTSPKLVREMWKAGLDQFLPFLVTIIAILLTDLLKGVGIGLLVGLFFIIRSNFKSAISYTKSEINVLIRLKNHVSFLNKARLRKELSEIPSNSYLLIDGIHATFIDPDIMECLYDFEMMAKDRSITVEYKKNKSANNPYFLES